LNTHLAQPPGDGRTRPDITGHSRTAPDRRFRWSGAVPPGCGKTRKPLSAWSDDYDGGLFESKQAAFAANALYRYWNMIGVKDAGLESLVGQAGEVAPVYEAYADSGFLFEPDGRRVHLPQLPRPGQTLRQRVEDGYLPVVETTYRVGTAALRQKALATTVGLRQRGVVRQADGDQRGTTRPAGRAAQAQAGDQRPAEYGTLGYRVATLLARPSRCFADSAETSPNPNW